MILTKQNEAVQPGGLVDAELRLSGGLSERFFDLLGAIAATGSISQAARKSGLSYKGAWDMLDRANNLSPRLLTSTQTGGRHGGGAQLTPYGRKLLDTFLGIQEQHRRFLSEVNSELLRDPELRTFFRRLIIRASARNQLFGAVESLRIGTPNVEVSLAMKGGVKLVASVTRASAEGLALQPGTEVVALVKAPLVMIVTEARGYRLSARNQLTGVVERLQKGAVNGEVVISLPGGDSLAATITNASFDRLGLEIGAPATAVFDADAVILGVAES